MSQSKIKEIFTLKMNEKVRINPERTLAIFRVKPKECFNFKNSPVKVSLEEIFKAIDIGEKLERSFFKLRNESQYNIELFKEILTIVPVKNIRELIAHTEEPLLILTKKYNFTIAPVITFAHDLTFEQTLTEYKRLQRTFFETEITIKVRSCLFNYRKDPELNNVSRKELQKLIHEAIGEKITAYCTGDWGNMIEEDVLEHSPVSEQLPDTVFSFGDLGEVEIIISEEDD